MMAVCRSNIASVRFPKGWDLEELRRRARLWPEEEAEEEVLGDMGLSELVVGSFVF